MEVDYFRWKEPETFLILFVACHTNFVLENIWKYIRVVQMKLFSIATNK
jgi:hypothetical protein